MAENPDAGEVRVESVEASIRQIAYFRAQAHRVVALLRVEVDGPMGGKEENIRLKIIKAMNMGTSYKKKAIQNSIFCKAEVFNGVWKSMFKPELIKIGEDLYTRSTLDLDQPNAGSIALPTTERE